MFCAKIPYGPWIGYLGYLGRGAASPRWVSLKMGWIQRICEKNQNGHFCAEKLARLAFFPKLEARTAPVEGRNPNFALKLYSQKASRMTPKRSKRIQWQTRVSTVILGQRIVPLVNIKIAGKWMFIPLKMVLIGIDPYPQ